MAKKLRRVKQFQDTTATVRLLIELDKKRKALRRQLAKEREREHARFLGAVTRPKQPAGSGNRAAIPTSRRTAIRILADGDSWFNYPVGPHHLPHKDGVIVQLEPLLGYPIDNIAKPGETAERLLGLSGREMLVTRLGNGQVKYDALLFSGSGNDFAGDEFCIFLDDSGNSPPPPDKLLNFDAVRGMQAVLTAEFEELIRIRDNHSPHTVIFVNCYDFPWIGGGGVCRQGPWLKPSLDWTYEALGVANPSLDDEFKVVKTLLLTLPKLLSDIAANTKKFIVVPTQGTLIPGPSADWQNEMHPSSNGFAKIARVFMEQLALQFP